MSMNEERFESLVARLELEQARNPAAYRRKVTLLAVAGYAYVAMVLIGSVVMLLASLALMSRAGALGLKLVSIFGVFFILVARAMWVRFTPPEGREVTRAEAPELFTLLDRLQRELRVGAHFHHVLITEDFNAAVAQAPRLGMLGWYRNYLLIGLPLLKALTREQFAAVLAHEIGHLAGGHARLGNWIYRLRLGWARLAAMLQMTESAGGIVFRPFFNRFVPYFNAVSFPLARANEYEADANAALLTSPSAAATALSTVDAMAGFLQTRFWPELQRRAIDQPRPEFSLFAEMDQAMTTHVDQTLRHGGLAEAMARKTSVADTHPALADRLRALGQEPKLALPVAGEAADGLLGQSLPSISADLDRRWRDGIAPAWEQRHQQAQMDRRRLAELDARAENGELDVDECLQRAMLTNDVGPGAAAAEEHLHALHADNPEHAATSFALGSLLLRRDDEQGMALIEQAIERAPDAIAPGCALLRDFHAKHGRDAQARHWHERWRERQELLEQAQAERGRISARDSFEPHGLPADAVEALRKRLGLVPAVRKAWLARKQVRYLPAQPHLVLAFTVSWWSLNTENKGRAALNRIVELVEFPAPVSVLYLQGGYARVGKKLRKIEGSRIL